MSVLQITNVTTPWYNISPHDQYIRIESMEPIVHLVLPICRSLPNNFQLIISVNDRDNKEAMFENQVDLRAIVYPSASDIITTDNSPSVYDYTSHNTWGIQSGATKVFYSNGKRNWSVS